MTHDAAQDRALSRLRSWRPRRPVEPAAAPGSTAVPAIAVSPDSRAPEISALLADLDTLRLGLSTDLGMAASAVEAGAFDVARDVVEGGLHDLATFSARAEQHLTEGPAEPSAGDEVAPSLPVSRRRGRRLAVLGPALTAAAAVVGLLTGVVPNGGSAPGPRPSVMSEAAASYAELWRLHEQGASPAQLREAARQLHAEVARLVDVAAADPATAAQALRLLELEVRVLDNPQHGGALAAEVAESQRLVEVLRRAALGAGVDDVVTSLPQPGALPSAPATGGVAGTAVPSPDVRRDDTGPAATGATPEAPSPAPVPQQAPSSQPAPQPSSSSEPPSSSEPQSEPSAPPSSRPPGSWFPTTGTGGVVPG